MTIRFSVSAVAHHVSPSSSSTHRGRQRRLGWLLAGGRYMLVANEGTEAEPDNRVSVIDLEAGSVASRHDTGQGPNGVTWINREEETGS